jgi:galactokinase
MRAVERSAQLTTDLSTYPTLTQEIARAFAPGRVNLIGEHTDYSGGLALPFAVAHGVTVTASALPDPVIKARALDLGEEDRFGLTAIVGGEGWRAFVRGVAFELQAGGANLTGAGVQIAGDLPRGAGLSSSAALCVSLYLALAALSGADNRDWIEIARLCQRVEHKWVGAQTGLLDPLASLSGTRHGPVLIDFETLEMTPVPLELGAWVLVVLDSGERHTHAESGYNQRRLECAQAAHRMGAQTLRGAMIQDLHMLPDVLARRAKHVISENGRVMQAVDAIRDGDLRRLGRLLDASHASLRDDFEVSTPALEAAVAQLKHAGAVGARLIGGGFGGNVLGLMPPGTVAPAAATVVSPQRGARLLGAPVGGAAAELR